MGFIGIEEIFLQVKDMQKALDFYHDYAIATESEEECRRLGEDLGDSYIMFMRNHGLLTVGRTVAEAFYFMYTVENACKVQLDVMASQARYVVPDEEARAGLGRWGRAPEDQPSHHCRLRVLTVPITFDK